MKLLRSLAAKLQTQTSPCLLVGLRGSQGRDPVLVVDLVVLPVGEGGAAKPHAATGELLPHGLAYVGVWAETLAQAQQLLQDAAILQLLSPPHGQAASSNSSSMACTLAYGSEVHSVELSAQPNKQPASKLGPSITPEVVAASPDLPLAWLTEQGLCVVRCRAALQLSVYLRSNDSGPERSGAEALAWQQAVDKAFQGVESHLADARLVFLVTSADNSQRTLIQPSTSGSVADVGVSGDVPIEAHAMLQAAPAHTSGNGVPAATNSGPVFEYHAVDVDSQGMVQEQGCALKLDILAYVSQTQSLAALGHDVLLPALRAQLQAAKAAVLRAGRVLRVTPLHFLPPGRCHHMSLVYPVLKASEDLNTAALAPYRRELHALLALPLDRPALRATNALTWRQEPAAGAAPAGAAAAPERLRDVHLGLPPPGPVGAGAGSVSLLQGSYEYRHYMQDRFDDSGWGCAYRSLQTICSWFRLQQYTSKPVPSHREVQQALVDMGDKDPAFVGSSQWIGAIELGYFLESYLDVSYKVITVNRGADIPSYARQLAAHFQSQGTPVMIGGGVLAYTLLGVYFDESTGDCAFLILDPHYTGGEVLGRIQKGTWVGWKRAGESAAAGGPLFVQDAFYNFLCPQRPKEV